MKPTQSIIIETRKGHSGGPHGRRLRFEYHMLQGLRTSGVQEG